MIQSWALVLEELKFSSLPFILEYSFSGNQMKICYWIEFSSAELKLQFLLSYCLKSAGSSSEFLSLCCFLLNFSASTASTWQLRLRKVVPTVGHISLGFLLQNYGAARLYCLLNIKTEAFLYFTKFYSMEWVVRIYNMHCIRKEQCIFSITIAWWKIYIKKGDVFIPM